MRNLRTFALFLALAGSLTLSARADNLAPNTWTLFTWQNQGDLVSSYSDNSTDFFANGPTTINITDGWMAGDWFTVYDNGVLLGTTSQVAQSDATCGDSPTACFADKTYSHGSWKVGAGQNDITLYATTAPYGGGGGWIESFSTVPEPGTITFLGSGLLCLAGVLRRRKAR
jgi:hypothetical protein